MFINRNFISELFQICGIIFDSSPGDRRLLSLYRAVSSIYGKNRRCSCIVSWCITLGLAVKWVAEVWWCLHWISFIWNDYMNDNDFDLEQDIFLRIKGMFSSKSVASINPYYDLKYLDNYIPQLFLYSNADKLIIPGVSILTASLISIKIARIFKWFVFIR